MTLIEWWAQRTPHFRCPRCGRISFNHNDIARRYCGACHVSFEHGVPDFDQTSQIKSAYAHFGQKRAREADTYRSEADTHRHNDDVSSPFPTFPTFSSDPAPPTAPDPPSFDPGGGSSGGGGASGDW
jgi:transcription elongation factor Elf1